MTYTKDATYKHPVTGEHVTGEVWREAWGDIPDRMAALLGWQKYGHNKKLLYSFWTVDYRDHNMIYLSIAECRIILGER